MNHHKKECSCCTCLKHSKCIVLLQPKWTCLMSNKINVIVIGPLNPLQTGCILEVIESPNKPFRILNKYIFPNFLTRMATLTVITPSPYILKPGDLVAKLCTVTTEQVLGEINGKNHFIS